MKPLGKRVLIEPIEEKREEASGIVRPEDSKKKEVVKGKIIAIGDDVSRVKVGDVVLHNPYQYDEIEKNLFVTEEVDIWVVLTTTTE